MPATRILLLEWSDAAGEPPLVAADLARAGAVVQRARDLPQVLALLTSDTEPLPELILLPESRPGIWSDRELDALRRAAPLARLVRISGSWCEGQNRSGRPPAGTIAMHWHQAAGRLQRELAEFDRGGRGIFAAPLTATSEDLLLASPQPPQRNLRDRLIAIHAPRATQAEAWAALCGGLGYRAEIAAPNAESRMNSADALLWDCDPRELAEGTRVQEFVRRSGGAPVVAICGFPRPRDVEIARQNGVAAVLAKPLLMSDLEWLFSRLFDARGAG